MIGRFGGTSTRGLGAGFAGSGEFARAGLFWIGGCAAVVSHARRSERSVALLLVSNMAITFSQMSRRRFQHPDRSHPENQRKRMDFHSFGKGVGGAGGPPTHKIKENLWIFIVFGGWGAGCPPPPHPQNQRKPVDFNSFRSGVGGGGWPPPATKSKKSFGFSWFLKWGAGPTHPQNPRNVWIFIVFGVGWGGAGGPPTHKIKENSWICIVF